jgi:hypothetical protein
MAASPGVPVTEHDLQGFTYFRILGPLFTHVHASGLPRERAGNRQVCYEQYATLRRLYCFSPMVTSLRGLPQASTLAQVQPRWGVRQTSLGSLSEAAPVFDAALRHEVMTEWGARLRPRVPLAEPEALQPLPAIAGSLVPALPKMGRARWPEAPHRAAKMHVAVAVLRQGPVGVTVTAGTASERAAWRRLGRPGGFSVMDRGDAE